MKVIAKAPATCGEFIQGIWRNQPCLISAPINMYSTVKIEPGQGLINLQPKACQLLKEFFRYYYIKEDFIDSINIKLESKIPVSIGFGSSTADCAALIKALATYFYIDITDLELAKFLIKVDPTDNIMFKDLNLFNHYTGDVLFEFKHSISSDLLILANLNEKVNTIDFGYLREFKRSEKEFKQILDLFFEGCLRNDLKLIGKATTKSAILNEKCIRKPNLFPILELVHKYNSYGILIGHSGSIIGIIKNSEFNENAFLDEFSKQDFFKNYRFYWKKLIKGGIDISYQFD